MDETTFDSLCVDIEAAYAKLGHTLGWRFLMGPKATLSDQTKIALITLNPGGNVEPPAHPRASVEAGNAYFIEQWREAPVGRSPLQVQVQALMTDLHARLGNDGSVRHFADKDVLSAYYIPFRSPHIKDLGRTLESIYFSNQMWRRVIKNMSLDYIITIGNDTFSAIDSIFSSEYPRLDHKKLESGWKRCTLEYSRYAIKNRRTTTIARFPHLSIFKLFSRPDCRPYIQEFLDHVTAA